MAADKKHKMEIPVTETDKHIIILSLQNGNFSEGDFKGEYYTDGAIMLFNMDDKRQFKVYVKDILIALKKTVGTK